MFSKVTVSVAVGLALFAATVRLPATPCFVTNTPSEKACQPGCCGIEPDTGDPVGRLLKVSPDMHPGGAEPDEERLLVGDSLVHELGSASKKLLINAGPYAHE
jgi:hypothetical protein